MREKKTTATAEDLVAGLAEAQAKLAEAETARAKAEAAKSEAEEALAETEAAKSQAEAKSKENWDLFLRSRADLENYRRRVERDLDLMVRRGKKDLLAKLLDVVDALERAAAAGADPGVTLILRQLAKVLADEGVMPINSLGQPFDPSCHEAVDVKTDDSVRAPTVADELQKGYTYGGEVIRPARVRVAQPAG